MAALQQLHSGLTFADAAVADQQNALAVNLHKNTMTGDAGCQSGLQIGDDGGNDGAGSLGRAQNGYVVLLGHFQADAVRLDVSGNEQGGELVGKQPVKNHRPLSVFQLGQIAHFYIAHDLQTHWFKMVKITCQLQSGTGHVLHRQPDGFIIGGGKGHFQVKFFHQCCQQHAVCIDHGNASQGAFWLLYPWRGRISIDFQKNEKF